MCGYGNHGGWIRETESSAETAKTYALTDATALFLLLVPTMRACAVPALSISVRYGDCHQALAERRGTNSRFEFVNQGKNCAIKEPNGSSVEGALL